MPRFEGRRQSRDGEIPLPGGPPTGEIPRPAVARRTGGLSCADLPAIEIGMEERRPLPAYLAIALFALVMAALLTPGLTLGL